MDDDDSLSLVKSVGESYGYRRTDDKNKEAFQFISNQKCHGYLPSDAEKLIKGHELEKKYFKDYERRKNEMHQLDFDDLIIYAIRILETYEDVRNKWASRFQHVLVDEFQDTNDLQFKLFPPLRCW